MNTEPKVAIIILTWNKKDYVLTLLSCIEKLDYKNYEVIVVDNASSDGTVDELKKSYPDIHLIVNKENLGGTGGFNTGIKYALTKEEYKYLWLLDNDVEVETMALTKLVKVLESSPKIAIAGSSMYDLTDKDKLIEQGYFIDLQRGKFTNNVPEDKPRNPGDNFMIVDSVSSCSLCVSKDAISNVGIWDESFFIYCDDVDWNLRFGEKGYKTACVTDSIIWHVPWLFKIGFNTSYYSNRNMMYLMDKHLPFPQKILGIIYKELSIIFLSLKLLKSGEYKHSIIVIRSVLDFFDKRFGKYNDDEYLKKIEGFSAGRSYIEWMKSFALLPLKSISYCFNETLDVAKPASIEYLRVIFKMLPEKTRFKIVQIINDYRLSK